MGPTALSAYYLQVLVAAGVLWAAAFVVFLAVYAPILVTPRPDERAPSSA